jgi:hypothetical protein
LEKGFIMSKNRQKDKSQSEDDQSDLDLPNASKKLQRTFPEDDLGDGHCGKNFKKLRSNLGEEHLIDAGTLVGSSGLNNGNQIGLHLDLPKELLNNAALLSGNQVVAANSALQSGDVVAANSALQSGVVVAANSDLQSGDGFAANSALQSDEVGARPGVGEIPSVAPSFKMEVGNPSDPLFNKMLELESVVRAYYPMIMENSYPLPSCCSSPIEVDNSLHTSQRFRSGKNSGSHSAGLFLGNKSELEFFVQEWSKRINLYLWNDLPYPCGA